MRLYLLFSSLPGLVIANPLALPDNFNRYAPITRSNEWKSCSNGNPVLCNRFEVPLDYENEAAGKASLLVAKYPATKEPKLGTLFLNPGGPGLSGVSYISGEDRSKIIEAVGNQYDLISWDPRGVGWTYPHIACFKTSMERDKFWHGAIPHSGIETPGDFADEEDIEKFYEKVYDVDGHLQLFGERCEQRNVDLMQYVGTAATVRDMVALHDFVENVTSPLNFWGLSYGTVIGSYFINLFPDRVGKVVLDGVVDPVNYASEPPHKQWAVEVSSADGAFDGFAEACATAGPQKCPFTPKSRNKEDIKLRFLRLLKSAYRREYNCNNHGSAFIRNEVFQAMYRPKMWQNLSFELFAYERCFGTDHESDLGQSLPPALESSDAPTWKDATIAISCSDAVDRGGVPTRTVFEEVVNVAKYVSRLFGPLWVSPGLYCHKWRVRAVERLSEGWSKILPNSILIIGNKYDPITPIKSARKLADMLKESAVLVEQDGWGHTSLAIDSNCTRNIIYDYFVHNIIPDANTVCKTDGRLFGDSNETVVSSKFGDPNSTASSTSIPTNPPGVSWNLQGLTSTTFMPICTLGFLFGLLMAVRWTQRERSSQDDADWRSGTSAGMAEFLPGGLVGGIVKQSGKRKLLL